jgi:hypothetical protein
VLQWRPGSPMKERYHSQAFRCRPVDRERFLRQLVVRICTHGSIGTPPERRRSCRTDIPQIANVRGAACWIDGSHLSEQRAHLIEPFLREYFSPVRSRFPSRSAIPEEFGHVRTLNTMIVHIRQAFH